MPDKKLIRFWDNTDLKLVKATEAVRDNFSQGMDGGRPLFVKVAATHAGIITRNNGFYLPDKMRAGVASWTQNYPKPVQAHHDDEEDPVGRVVKARYVDLSANIKDKWVGQALKDSKGNQTGTVDSAFLSKFNNGKLPYLRSVDFILDSLLKDGKLDDPDYEGIGYIELWLNIADAQAQQKILDGRYLTGSVAVSTNRAVCSVCKEDWAAEDRCEHRPGKVYDGTKAFLITGDLTYDEYSFVNRPADRHSRVIQVSSGGQLLDSVSIEENEFTGTMPSRPYELLMSDKEEAEDSVSVKTQSDKQMVISAHDGLHFRYDYRIRSDGQEKRETYLPKDDVDLHSKLHKEAKAGEFLGALMPGELDSTLEEKSLYPPVVIITKKSQEDKTNTMADEASKNETQVSPEDPDNKLEELVAQTLTEDKAKLEALVTSLPALDAEKASAEFDNVLKQTSFVVPANALANIKARVLDHNLALPITTTDGLLEELAKAEWANYSEEKDQALVEAEDLKDAKLSTEKRKKLAGSTFCGPNRSFPVPDCSHVTAARRLIGRAKASAATKSRILACVSRKSRALGCSSGSKDSVQNKDNNVAKEQPTPQAPELTLDQVTAWLRTQKFEDMLKAITDYVVENSHEIAKLGLYNDMLEKQKTLSLQIDAFEKQLAEKACPECKDNLGKADELQKQVDALRTELKLAYTDLESLQDQYLASHDQLHLSKLQRAMDLDILGGKSFKDSTEKDTYLSQLTDKSDQALDAYLEERAKAVDITRIADTISSGLARVPSGTVEDPVSGQTLPGNTSVSGVKTMVDRRVLEDVTQEYMRILFGGKSKFGSGQVAANRYLDNLKAQGTIPMQLDPRELREQAGR